MSKYSANTGIKAIANAPPEKSEKIRSGILLATLKASMSAPKPNCLAIKYCLKSASILFKANDTPIIIEALNILDIFNKQPLRSYQIYPIYDRMQI